MRYSSLNNHKIVCPKQKGSILKKHSKQTCQQGRQFANRGIQGAVQIGKQKIVNIAWVDKKINQFNAFKQIIYDRELKNIHQSLQKEQKTISSESKLKEISTISKIANKAEENCKKIGKQFIKMINYCKKDHYQIDNKHSFQITKNIQPRPQKSQIFQPKQQPTSIKQMQQKSKINRFNIKLQTQRLQEYLIQQTDLYESHHQQQEYNKKIQQKVKYCILKKQLPIQELITHQIQNFTAKNQFQQATSNQNKIIYDIKDQNPLKQKVNNQNTIIQKIQFLNINNKMIIDDRQCQNIQNIQNINKLDNVYINKENNDLRLLDLHNNEANEMLNHSGQSKRKQQRKLNAVSKLQSFHAEQSKHLKKNKQFIKPSQFMPTSYFRNISSNIRRMQNKRDSLQSKENRFFCAIQSQLINSKANTLCKENKQESIQKNKIFGYKNDLPNIVQQEKQAQTEITNQFTVNRNIIEELKIQQIQKEDKLIIAKTFTTFIDENSGENYNAENIVSQSLSYGKKEEVNMIIQQKSFTNIKKMNFFKQPIHMPINIHKLDSSQKNIPNDNEMKKYYSEQLIILFNFMDENHRGLLTDTNCNINLLTEELKLLFSSIIIPIRYKKKFYNLKKFIQDCIKVIQIKNQLYFINTQRKYVAYHILKQNIYVLKNKYPLQFGQFIFTNQTYDQCDMGLKKNSILIEPLQRFQSNQSQIQSLFARKNRRIDVDQSLYSDIRVNKSKQKYLAKSILNEYRLNSEQPELYLQRKYGINKNENTNHSNKEPIIMKNNTQNKL